MNINIRCICKKQLS